MLDPASTHSYITTRLVYQLRAKKRFKVSAASGFQGAKDPDSHYTVDVILSTHAGDEPSMQETLRVIDQITTELPSQEFHEVRKLPLLQRLTSLIRTLIGPVE